MLPEERNGVPPVASFLVGVKDENVRASIRVTLWWRKQQQKHAATACSGLLTMQHTDHLRYTSTYMRKAT